jgi:hypothetical protein
MKKCREVNGLTAIAYCNLRTDSRRTDSTALPVLLWSDSCDDDVHSLSWLEASIVSSSKGLELSGIVATAHRV